MIWAIVIFGVTWYVFAKSNASSKSKSLVKKSRQENPNSSFGIRITVTSNGSAKREDRANISFLTSGAIARVHGISIPAHLLYVGESSDRLPHLVRPRLPIADDLVGIPKLGYWPDYESIGPANRSEYLNWLASGRSNHSIDIGYVFLYFYGLEYRAIDEKANHDEILSECVRLYSIYAPGNRSFERYCADFMSWLVVSNPSWLVSRLAPILELPKMKSSSRASLDAIVRGRLTDKSSFDFFFSRLVQDDSYVNSPVYLSAQDEFKTVFKSKFSQFTTAVDWLENSTETFQYNTATSLRLRAEAKLESSRISKGRKSQIAPIWKECAKELAGYASLMREGNPFAHIAAPASVVEILATPKARESATYFSTIQESRIISISNFLSLSGEAAPAKFSIAYSRKIRDAIVACGLEVEPDPDIEGRSYRKESDLIVYKPASGSVNADKSKKAVLLFDLAMMVALSKGKVTAEETAHVEKQVCTMLKLSGHDAYRIAMRGELYRSAQVNSLNSKKLIESLSGKEKDLVARFLISIAALDGVLEDTEVKSLEKAFKFLDFADGTLDRLLSEIARHPTSPVLLKSPSEASKKGSPIPTENTASTTFIIDKRALEAAFAEADAVGKVLSSVFIDDPETIAETKSSSADSVASKELKVTESQLLEFLMTRASWELSEVEDKCRELKLMYGGAIQSLNNWAEAQFEEPIIEEDGDTVLINRGLIDNNAGVISA
jgi:hypothetical protein